MWNFESLLCCVALKRSTNWIGQCQLSRLVDYNLGGIVNIEQLVRKANHYFLEDHVRVLLTIFFYDPTFNLMIFLQKTLNGDSTLYCCPPIPNSSVKIKACGATAGICQNFYDSAPSGCYGTMSYLIRAVANEMDCLPKEEVDCNISWATDAAGGDDDGHRSSVEISCWTCSLLYITMELSNNRLPSSFTSLNYYKWIF